MDARRRDAIRAALVEHRARPDAEDLLALAILFSIEARDDLASTFAREWSTREAFSPRTPIAALILWIASDREEAALVAARFGPIPQGWFSQAAESMHAFLQAADAAPADGLRWIIRPAPTEGLRKQPTSVGALVRRLAFMRMRAHAELGERDEAAKEAHAVVGSHGYRAYDPHVQAPCLEFDVRLVDRLQVSPAEVREARTMIASHPDVEDPVWLLREGSLLRREADRA